MKKTTPLKYTIIAAIAIVALLFVNSCKKESKECKAVITVKKVADTMQTVSYAKIVIGPEYDYVRVDGTTDISGKFSCTFKYEGVLDVLASKPIEGTSDSLFGKAVLRLVPGETINKTVFVQ
jgi:hypothetical protein